MSLILDSSEIREAIGLAGSLTTTLSGGPPATSAAEPVPAPEPQKAAVIMAEIDPADLVYRGDRLEQVLANMCRRSSFSGAMITDITGLPFAAVNPPADIDASAAFMTILGDTLQRAGTYLGYQDADFLAMDISYDQKIVLHRFSIEDRGYLLFAICPQDVDERSEIELSIEQIIAILADRT